MHRTFRIVILIAFCSMMLPCYAQSKVDMDLKAELDSIYALDQKYRGMLSGNISTKADSLAKVFHVSKDSLISHVWKIQNTIDSANLIRVKEIIKKYGYPGKSLVDTPANEAAFYVIQHSKSIDHYLPLIKKAAESDELPFRLYAMMLDRSLMYQNKEQIYGTQASGFQVTDPKSGKKQMVMVIWPIKDAADVNKRRKDAGFEQTVEENAKRLGVDYKVYTLDEILKMKGT